MDENFCRMDAEIIEPFPAVPLAVETSVEPTFSGKVEKLELSNHFQQLSSGADGFVESNQNGPVAAFPTDSVSTVIVAGTSSSEALYQMSSFDMNGQQGGESAEQKDSCNSPLEDTSDCHKCGICSVSMTSLIEFLKHKILHLAASKSSGCELCGVAYAREQSLFEHYKRKHKVVMMPGSKRGRPPKSRSRPEQPAAQCKGGNSSELPAKEVHVVITRSDSGGLGLATVESTAAADVGGRPQTLEGAGGSVQDMGSLNSNISASVSGAGMLSATGQSVLEMAGASGSDSTTVLAEGVERLLGNSLPTSSTASQEASATAGSEPAPEADTGPDFHFILVTRKIQGNSLNYGKQGFRCLHCEFKTSWKNSLVKHMKENHADMISIHRSMATNSAVKNAQTSDNQILMSLSEYDASVAKRNALPKRVRGIESQDLAGTFPCTKCNKVFGRLRYLRKHMITHKPDNKYLCDECGKSFKTPNYLQVHRKSHRTKEYHCSQCNFSSSVNSVIHTHRQIHNDGCMLCDICGAAYADRSTLKKHKMVHDPSRPFACQFEGCTWRFKSEMMCHAHFKTHTTEATFKCNVCQYCFRHKHHLQRHQAKMHGIPKTKAVSSPPEEGGGGGGSGGSSKSENKENPSGQEVILPSLTNTLNVFMSPEQLQTALASGNLVITTDVDGNVVNYEVADVAYHTLMQESAVEDGGGGEGQTILIPHTSCNQIIFQQEAEI